MAVDWWEEEDGRRRGRYRCRGVTMGISNLPVSPNQEYGMGAAANQQCARKRRLPARVVPSSPLPPSSAFFRCSRCVSRPPQRRTFADLAQTLQSLRAAR